jgi:hypothetical protein
MDTNKKKILEALEIYKGIVTSACKSVNLPRSTYYSWLETDQEFKDAVAEIQDTAIDFVESKLMEKINGVTIAAKGPDDEDVYHVPPSDTAIIFFLKTRGKKRGYVERMEVDNMNAIALLTLDPLNASATNDSPAQDSGTI